MFDIHKRKIDYIRISVTDRCNLRCVYCMPEEGVQLIEREKVLSYEEIIRLCKLFAKLGIEKIKITGGEPLVRKDIEQLIKGIKDIEGIKEVTLTTNGILLGEKIERLVEAGLDAVNISIDTIDKEEFKKLTRLGDVDTVLKAIDKCLSYKNLRVKLNAVPIKGETEEDLINVVNLARDKNLSVRFIELMPIGFGKNMKSYSEDEIKEIIERKIGPLEEYKGRLGNGPSHYYSLEGYKGKIGFISAINHKFCDDCNRVRLTSEGFLKSCLHFNSGVNLKELINKGVDDDTLLKAIEESIHNKPKGHNFNKIDIQSKEKIDKRSMSQIGG